MQKKKIAVIFGGNSTEYEVSLQSAFSVFENINKEKFDIVPIGITRNGDWYHYTGKKEKIANNTWFEDNENLYSVAVSQNRSKINCGNGVIRSLIKRLIASASF